jgi:hypothetical protein
VGTNVPRMEKRLLLAHAKRHVCRDSQVGRLPFRQVGVASDPATSSLVACKTRFRLLVRLYRAGFSPARFR